MEQLYGILSSSESVSSSGILQTPIALASDSLQTRSSLSAEQTSTAQASTSTATATATSRGWLPPEWKERLECAQYLDYLCGAGVDALRM